MGILVSLNFLKCEILPLNYKFQPSYILILKLLMAQIYYQATQKHSQERQKRLGRSISKCLKIR